MGRAGTGGPSGKGERMGVREGMQGKKAKSKGHLWGSIET